MIKAPYNFVPLAQTVVFPDWAEKISMDIPFKDGISGTIDVKYTAQTPVFIGNGKEKDTTVVKNYKAANGQYALPGSSLRGMLRNVIEIASFGKFSRIDDSILSVRDLSNPKLYGEHFTKTENDAYKALSKAGWLIYEKEQQLWFLYPVEYHRLEDSELEEYYSLYKKYDKNTDPKKRRKMLVSKPEVHFRAERECIHKHHFNPKKEKNLELIYSKATLENSSSQNSKVGYVVLTGKVGRKHMDFIFERKENNAIPIVLDKQVIKNFNLANEPNAAIQQDGISLTEEINYFKNNNYPGIPVFYLADENGEPNSFGLAQMYRLPYKHSIKKAAGFSSKDHNDERKMDLPECIFGEINKDSYSLRGRVQFEDATAEGKVSLASTVSKVLNGPKPSYYPTYIEQNAGNKYYSTLMDENVHLRGWKRYPVHSKADKSDDSQASDKLKTRYTPLAEGSVFEGKIHFHNLKPEELGALLWAITWNNKKELSHSIGMGKPYGFGQIKAEIKLLSYLENSIISNDYAKADAEKISTWQNEFSTYMESNINGWKNSSQLKELFAIANPKNAERSNWNLEHMKLGKPNEFVDAKKSNEYLAPYSQNNQSLLLSGGGSSSGNYKGSNKQQWKSNKYRK